MRKIINLFAIKEVRKRIFYTLLAIAVFRFLAHIPIPGADLAQLQRLFSGNQLLGLLNVFSGGAMENFSVVSLGLNPYINASIIFQLLTYAFPYFKELSKEGEYGRAKINRYTRFLAFPLALVQAYGLYFLLTNQGVVEILPPLGIATLIFSLAAGSVLLMWIGELLSEYGVGNGISLLIFTGIAASYPLSLAQTFSVATAEQIFSLLGFLVLFVGVIFAVVFVNEAARIIPVEYATRARFGRVFTPPSANIPLRVNNAGVIPIIFAISLVLLPGTLARFFQTVSHPAVQKIVNFSLKTFSPQSISYNAIYFLLVVFFTYFYTAVVFNTDDLAENLQKRGGFIPGVRPGRSTSAFIGKILTKVTLFGAIFLGAIAVLPSFSQGASGVATLTLGGTGILIVVSVVLETVRKIESLATLREYEGFL